MKLANRGRAAITCHMSRKPQRPASGSLFGQPRLWRDRQSDDRRLVCPLHCL